MKGYLELLQKILDEGCEKESGRANMPNTWGIEYGLIEMDMSKGFPLLTTKQMFWKGIVHELLWFLRGETNIKYLVDNGVNIWNGDGYRWYLKQCTDKDIKPHFKTQDEFKKFVKETKYGMSGTDAKCTLQKGIVEMHYPDLKDMVLKNHLQKLLDFGYMVGDLGKVYGAQWRNQHGVDQIQEVLDGLKANPWSRYHIIDGWNKADFPDMALPPCHLLYQFIVKPISAEDRWDLFQNVEWNLPLNMKDDSDKTIHDVCDRHGIPKFYLNLNMYQRSCDTFLGVPFNIASMSLLLQIFAKVSNMIPGKSRWIGGDVHLYMKHIPVAKEQLTRAPKLLPQMIIKKDLNSLEDILGLTIEDFELENYESFGKLKGELFTGNKK